MSGFHSKNSGVPTSSFRVISFAGGKAIWARSAERLFKQAWRSNFISSLRIYTPADLDSLAITNISDFKSFVNRNPRGFGYWIWKPALILRELDLLGNELGVAWIDCGCTLNFSTPESREAWRGYEQKAQSEHFKFFQLVDHRHRSWTKSAAFDAIDPTRQFSDNSLYAATAFFVANDQQSRDFLMEWLYFVTLDQGRLVDDTSSEAEIDPYFIEHRHDQSIMSLLLERLGYRGEADETYFPSNWNRDGRKFPIWATRLRSGFASTSTGLPMLALRKVERLLVNLLCVFKKRHWHFDR